MSKASLTPTGSPFPPAPPHLRPHHRGRPRQGPRPRHRLAHPPRRLARDPLALPRRHPPPALLGQFAGIALLRQLDAAALKLLASAVVVAFALLLIRGLTLPGAHHPASSVLAGGLSGVLSTATGLSGPPVVLLFTLRAYPVTAFRATTVTFFVALDLVGLPTLVAEGMIDRNMIRIVLTVAPAAFAGRYAGARLIRHVSPPLFRRLTLALLLLTGTTGILGVLLPLP